MLGFLIGTAQSAIPTCGTASRPPGNGHEPESPFHEAESGAAQLTMGSRGMWLTRSQSPSVTIAVSPMHMLSPVVSSSRIM